jgi:hypothetical protein
LIPRDIPGVRLIPPGDAAALVEAVRDLRSTYPGDDLYPELKQRISVEHLGQELTAILDQFGPREKSA